MSGSEELTPLDRLIRTRVAAEGLMSVHDYMALCLDDPEHGYYRRRDAIGRMGDFITAPEISQVFGELIGLWSAAVGEATSPAGPLDLIEIGPGRGTLMADALRALKVVPDLLERLTVHLVEPSRVLAQLQRQTLAGTSVRLRWHEELAAVPDGPAVIVANEVIDALPVRQLVMQAGHWHERVVILDEKNALAFSTAPEPVRDLVTVAPEGSLLELRPGAETIVATIAQRSRAHPTVALLIDYGHERSGFGDTLQAVASHQRSDPLSRAGEADLTAQVDFEALAGIARAHGLACDGPVPQAAFLGALGVVARAERLMHAARPAQAARIEAGVLRLIDPNGMGSRFKVLGLRPPGMARLPGL